MPLEHRSLNCYFGPMRFEIVRRLFVVVLSVALAGGLVVRSVQCGIVDTMAPAAATAAASIDTDMPMSGKCNGCAGDEEAMAAACSALCGSAVALLPFAVAFEQASIETVSPRISSPVTAHAFPPDPYPPRPSILS
jgi:hypothetical protein